MKRIYSVSNTKRRAIIIVAQDEAEAIDISRHFRHCKDRPTKIIDTTNGWPQYSNEAKAEVRAGVSGWAFVKFDAHGYQWMVMDIKNQPHSYTYYKRN